jgi:hypothetical protein
VDCAFCLTRRKLVGGKDQTTQFNGGQVVLVKQYSELFILTLRIKHVISWSVNYGSSQSDWVKPVWIWNRDGSCSGEAAVRRLSG